MLGHLKITLDWTLEKKLTSAIAKCNAEAKNEKSEAAPKPPRGA